MQNSSDLGVEKHCEVFTMVHCLRASIYETSPSLVNSSDNDQMCCWLSFPACLLRKKPSWHILHKPRSKAIIIRIRRTLVTHPHMHLYMDKLEWRIDYLDCIYLTYTVLYMIKHRTFDFIVNKQQHNIDTCICIFQPFVSLISINNPSNLLIINCVLQNWYAKDNFMQGEI